MTNRVNATESYDLNHSQTESALASQRDVTVSEEEVRSGLAVFCKDVGLDFFPGQERFWMSVVLGFTSIEFLFLPLRQRNEFRRLIKACPERFDNVELFVRAKF